MCVTVDLSSRGPFVLLSTRGKQGPSALHNARILIFKKIYVLLQRSLQGRVVNGPHFEARTRPESDIYF